MQIFLSMFKSWPSCLCFNVCVCVSVFTGPFNIGLKEEHFYIQCNTLHWFHFSFLWHSHNTYRHIFVLVFGIQVSRSSTQNPSTNRNDWVFFTKDVSYLFLSILWEFTSVARCALRLNHGFKHKKLFLNGNGCIKSPSLILDDTQGMYICRELAGDVEDFHFFFSSYYWSLYFSSVKLNQSLHGQRRKQKNEKTNIDFQWIRIFARFVTLIACSIAIFQLKKIKLPVHSSSFNCFICQL